MRLSVSLIVPAAGSGERFRRGFDEPSRVPSKLLQPLLGKPLLVRTLLLFQNIPEISETLVAVSEPDEFEIKKLIRQFSLKRIQIVRGGNTRAESVFNALKKCASENEWVMVHDGARPLLKVETLDRFFQAAEAQISDGMILAKRVIPTIKEANSKSRIVSTVDRGRLYEAETPQLVRRLILEQAYEQERNAFHFTDEASLLEAMGADVRVVIHEDWNPKITTRQDFELAEAYLLRTRYQSSEFGTWYGSRSGIGHDTHRLTSGRKLYLGGLHIPFPQGGLGHSDGDVLLHAVIDAILGALGSGDIGEWFSDKDPKYKGIRSPRLLEAILSEAQKKSWKIEQVDSTIHLERPQLGAHKHKIRKNLAKLLGISEDRVAVKAKTGEGLGPIGEGRAIAADALVVLGRIGS